jgi:carbon-monoxide dehydrogenase large subunit
MQAPFSGRSLPRLEDGRFLTGNGRYIDDLNLPRQLHAVVVRSPHPHARIAAIDISAGLSVPGVAAVFTGDALAEAGIGPLPCIAPIANADGTPILRPPRPVLARDVVRYVGEGVAFVVAESLAAARDVAEAIEIDYDPLPANVETGNARSPDAPRMWPEAHDNQCFHWRAGDGEAAEQAFSDADHAITLDLVNNRLVPNPLEPRGALAEYDPGHERYTLHTSSQGSYLVRLLLAEPVLHIPVDRLRVVTPDVGGGFGVKAYVYPEHALVCWASRMLGRPVKWIADRSECFLADTHGRDHVTHAQLALDKDGSFRAVRMTVTANMGAYAGVFGPAVPTIQAVAMVNGCYRFDAIDLDVTGIFTNTPPIDVYRGAGRPEPIYALERLVDAAARELAIDPAELRRHNFIRRDAMPYKTAAGATYDGGDFSRNLDDALEAADKKGFEARRSDAANRKRLSGFGYAYYIEQCAHARDEAALVRFEPSGAVTVLAGAQSNGQGHETTFAQLVADRFGLPLDAIHVVQGDSDSMPYGFGTFASRSLAIGGHAIIQAVDAVIDRARLIAAGLLEADVRDIEFGQGRFAIAGTDRSVSMTEVAATAYNAMALPPGAPFGLEAPGHFAPAAPTFPNGAHVCEVEVDPETGAVAIIRYTVVDDFGRIVNPMIVEGQVHGGVAQGIGQALLEACRFEAESGQMLTASFMDYAMPRADDLPVIGFSTNEVPCTTNALGVKGAGEAGTIGAAPAVINAILDALAPLGVTHIDMPATPEAVWRAIQVAKSGGNVA